MNTITNYGPEIVAAAERLDARFLDDQGRLTIVSCTEYDAVPGPVLRCWAGLRGFYLLPTWELVEWLAPLLAACGRTAIEIGSGNGALGRALDIPCTDSCVQRDNPDVRAYYEMGKQPIVPYGTDIVKHEALDAITAYDADVVLGAWVTQWVDPDRDPPPGGGSIYGIREDQILARGCTYLHIGNGVIHGRKQIRALPHAIIVPPGLRSRASLACADVAYLWSDVGAPRASQRSGT